VYMSYTTLHTTAVALGDNETAALAKRSFIEVAKFVTDIDHLVPPTVLVELQDGDLGSLDSGAPQQTLSAMGEAWVGPEQSLRAAGGSMAGRA